MTSRQEKMNSSSETALQQVGGNFDFYLKKTKKITSALHLITNHFDREEPLKWRIRQNATELLRLVSGVRDTSGQILEERRREIAVTIEELSSYLHIAAMSGLVSTENSDLCFNELRSLSEGIARASDLRSVESGGAILSSTFFDTGYPESGEGQNSARKREGHEDTRAEHDGVVASGASASIARGAAANEETSYSHAYTEGAPAEDHKAAESPKPAVQAKKTKRQHTLLRLIRERGEISVGDAASVITECSEKTLQRELQALVRDGILRKEGKRRWTRYSFA